VERLLGEARDRAVELARARDEAEKSASQNAKLYENEQARRHAVEALARSSRQLSSLATADKLPQQILEQLQQVLPYDSGVLFIEDVNSEPVVKSHIGFSEGAPISDFKLKINGVDFYKTVARKGEILLVSDVNSAKSWEQPEWAPQNRSWMGVPLYSKDNVIGLLALGRARNPFSEDDSLLATTFAMQATVALDNARLYEEVMGISQMMERMVSQRVEELNNAYNTLAKHDKNKSAFIQVAAHELRTPLTVIKGYLGMLQSAPAIKSNEPLSQAIDGVLQGTNRLHQIVNSMLDVARLDSQVVNPHIEPMNLSLIVRLVHKDYIKDLESRNLNFIIDDEIKDLPPILADPELFKKALDHVIVNAIKFTPDGGTITVSAVVVDDPRAGKCAEIRVKDTGIGIDAEHHKIIFEKLYQLGKVELHSSSRTNYKGGGAGLGLAIAQGILKALQGNIWVESAGHDEVNYPGSTFFIRLPLVR
jgi:signal transduction histidine kinase